MKPETIARAIVLAITLLNMILTMLGKAPLNLDENTIYVTVSGLWTIAYAFWCYWKNNSFTPEAIAADRMMREMKQNRGSEGDGLHEL